MAKDMYQKRKIRAEMKNNNQEEKLTKVGINWYPGHMAKTKREIGDLLPLMELILISLASGMILYITLFELLKEIFNYKKEKKVYQGMLIGILLIIIMTIIN